MNLDELTKNINELVKWCNTNSVQAGWWNKIYSDGDLLDDKEYAPYVIATKLLLIISEVTEAMEGDRKGLMDDKLPHRSALEVELADAVIRIADLAGKLKLDLAGAIVEKIGFNTTRPDHMVINRRKPGGKKY